jgi:hypothetical protein
LKTDFLTPPDWYTRPMRWAQLAFVENDPGNYDPGFWLDYFQRIHADGAVLSAGGYVAYYPTRIPLHYRSAWLGDMDTFGEMVAGCRKLGMAVIARTDPHAIHHEAFTAHPDWVAVTADGQPRPHWSMPGAWVTCALGPYNFEFMTQVHREIMNCYRVDAIFSNRWVGHGLCYCEHCRRNFWDFCKMELPVDENDGNEHRPTNPAWVNYLQWRQERLLALCRLWDGEMRKINPHACYIPNSGGGALSDLDMKQLAELVPLPFADRQGRAGLLPPWGNGKNAKEYRAAFGSKPIGGMFNVGLEVAQRWKDSVQSEAELRIWAAEGIANGMRPWFVKFSAVLYDHRWLKVVEELYTWHHANQQYLRNVAPLARVGVVYSQQTARIYGGRQAQQKVEDHILGVYQALIEARIPFEMVHDQLLDAEHLHPFKTLILPNVAVLSDQQCQQLREFVSGGGGMVATFETSGYDENGQQRTDPSFFGTSPSFFGTSFGLADLFGLHPVESVAGPLKNTYLNVEKGSAYPELLAGLEEAERLIYGVYRLPVEATLPMINPPLTYLPPYPDLPMEEVYPRTVRTTIPEVYLRSYGEGRLVYFPWDIDRTFWEVLNADHGRLIANAVRWVTNEDQPVTVSGPGLLDVSIWKQAQSLTVHLVNLTNPLTMRGFFRELIPLGGQEVRLRIPAGMTVKEVRLLKAGQTIAWQEADGWISFTVPQILDHEVIAII